MTDFAARLMRWQRRHGRHDLPWQQTREPYRIWLSEIMLQQTQVDTVVPYYRRFLQRFPHIASLAAAELEEVLGLWSGLGYYARARNLHACARRISAEHGGRFPAAPEAIAALPGIGRSTAAAIAVFAFDARAAILDGNVKRVLCRHFGIEGFPGRSDVEARLWALAESLLPEREVATYIQAQMDLGATVCTRSRPACQRCPLRQGCVALAADRVGELPQPRPRKTRPRRQQQVLVVRREGRILLEQRPPSGLWGGLWVLPEYQGEAGGLAEALQRRYGLQLGAVSPLPALEHGFTHFTLLLLPLLADTAGAASRVAEAEQRWIDPGQLAELPLPTPVRRILQSLPSPAAAAGAVSGRSG